MNKNKTILAGALLLVGIAAAVLIYVIFAPNREPGSDAAAENSGSTTVGDNDVQLAGVAASAGAAAEAEKPVLSPEEVEADAVRVLGIKKGEPLETGFMFVDGRYIDAPYVVSRKGRQLFVNDEVVWHPVKFSWPLPNLWVEEDPGPPPEAYSKATSVNELYGEKDSHIWRKTKYLWQHFPDEVAREKFIEYVRQLPTVEILGSGQYTLRVKFKGGSEDHIYLTPPSRMALNFTNDDLVCFAEFNRLGHERRLQEGRAVFVFPSLGHYAVTTMSAGKVPALLDAVTVLRSERPEAEKLEILRKQGFFSCDDNQGNASLMDGGELALVRQFAASEQLEERLRKLAAAAARAGDRR